MKQSENKQTTRYKTKQTKKRTDDPIDDPTDSRKQLNKKQHVCVGATENKNNTSSKQTKWHDS